MQLEEKTLLHDVLIAAERIKSFTHGKDFPTYQIDDMLRAAVERQLEIIGEALNQLSRTNPDLAGRITEYQRIIAFRNILIHGYAQVDNRLVWSVVNDKLPILLVEVRRLLEE
ncbi:MAG TPA: hypothetical protein DDW55_12695 [Gammaproteobacteria bacterium]|nr:hypothetical protein [Gammaproteobacteria bacterium]